MVCIKEDILCKRRYDLEPQETECIWIELVYKHKYVLFGAFYRAPNSDSLYYEGPAKSFVTGFRLFQCYVLSNIFLLQTFKVFPFY